ncbi:restriction endonuclease subunit S [Helicobacter vulpis]|uniref:restriction endonuclease subunit S n=1 Tax=Helicobacter vulpis TaxID=2316076 RepID=UPI000EAFE3A7|nr:restriction endonuclease subunit S [Helicobacter vulpis]
MGGSSAYSRAQGHLSAWQALCALEWGEVRVGEIFEVRSSARILHANTLHIEELPKEGFYPYVVRSARNNGIRGFIKEDPAFLNPGKTLSFAMDTFSVFYQERPYFTGNNVKILAPKFTITRNIGLFIATALQKRVAHLSWGTNCTLSDIEKLRFSLPHTPNNQIAFEAIEVFIRELQAERLRELQAYLKVTGLEDTTLTPQEEHALKIFTEHFENRGGGGASRG